MGLTDLVFPKNCLECGNSGGYICESCLKKVRGANLVCSECGRYSFGGKTHKYCRRGQCLDGTVSIWKYEGVMRKAVIKLKYNFAYEIAKELVQKSIFEIKNRTSFPRAILVPIPLHRRRQNWRGFNQAEEIGRLVADEFGWKFLPNLLVRKISTLPQVSLSRERRRENVKEVFSLNPIYRSLTFRDNLFLIFDDVWTTGSTIKEACKVLKKAGAKEVWGLTIAS